MKVGACVLGEDAGLVELVQNLEVLYVTGREQSAVPGGDELGAHHLQGIGLRVVVDDGGLELEGERSSDHGDDVTFVEALPLKHDRFEHGGSFSLEGADTTTTVDKYIIS